MSRFPNDTTSLLANVSTTLDLLNIPEQQKQKIIIALSNPGGETLMTCPGMLKYQPNSSVVVDLKYVQAKQQKYFVPDLQLVALIHTLSSSIQNRNLIIYLLQLNRWVLQRDGDYEKAHLYTCGHNTIDLEASSGFDMDGSYRVCHAPMCHGDSRDVVAVNPVFHDIYNALSGIPALNEVAVADAQRELADYMSSLIPQPQWLTLFIDQLVVAVTAVPKAVMDHVFDVIFNPENHRHMERFMIYIYARKGLSDAFYQFIARQLQRLFLKDPNIIERLPQKNNQRLLQLMGNVINRVYQSRRIKHDMVKRIYQACPSLLNRELMQGRTLLSKLLYDLFHTQQVRSRMIVWLLQQTYIDVSLQDVEVLCLVTWYEISEKRQSDIHNLLDAGLRRDQVRQHLSGSIEWMIQEHRERLITQEYYGEAPDEYVVRTPNTEAEQLCLATVFIQTLTAKKATLSAVIFSHNRIGRQRLETALSGIPNVLRYFDINDTQLSYYEFAIKSLQYAYQKSDALLRELMGFTLTINEKIQALNVVFVAIPIADVKTKRRIQKMGLRLVEAYSILSKPEGSELLGSSLFSLPVLMDDMLATGCHLFSCFKPVLTIQQHVTRLVELLSDQAKLAAPEAPHEGRVNSQNCGRYSQL